MDEDEHYFSSVLWMRIDADACCLSTLDAITFYVASIDVMILCVLAFLASYWERRKGKTGQACKYYEFLCGQIFAFLHVAQYSPAK